MNRFFDQALMINRKLYGVFVGLLLLTHTSWAQVQISALSSRPDQSTLKRMSEQVSLRTSIDLDPQIYYVRSIHQLVNSRSAFLWIPWGERGYKDTQGALKKELVIWLRRGGFLVIEDRLEKQEGEKLTQALITPFSHDAKWGVIPPDHELMRSFHLLSSLPLCSGLSWQGFHFDQRMAILVIPYGFLDSVKDHTRVLASSCAGKVDYEFRIRLLINILMVALATDYKKDQIHLPEILKRIR